MHIVQVQQGSPEWHKHRATHFNSSDAPAMMGCSPHKTRQQLLHETFTGLQKEFSHFVQTRILDKGHEFEARAREYVEENIVGQDLYPLTATDGGKLSASFDGITDDGFLTNWEHKRLNKELRTILPEEGHEADLGDDLPLFYRVQMEQQHMIAENATKTLFTASEWSAEGELIGIRHCTYTPNPELRKQIVAGWAQFEIDLANFKPPALQQSVVGNAVTDLPAVFAQVSGSISIQDNMPAFEVALRDFIEQQLIREPETDQDFADLDLQIKALKKAEAALDAADEQAVSQFEALASFQRTKTMLHKMARDNRLAAEKLSAARKEQIKLEQVSRGRDELAKHIDSLNTRLGKPWMPAINADFAGVIKGKRTVSSLQSAINDALAAAKIEANAVADLMQVNLAMLDKQATEYAFLFADAQGLLQKPCDDFALIVESRISAHKSKEQARLDAERERMRAEEEVKARAKVEQEAKAAQAKAEQEKVQAEAAAKVVQERVAPKEVVKPVAAIVVEVAKPKVYQARPDSHLWDLDRINTVIAPMTLTADGLKSIGIVDLDGIDQNTMLVILDVLSDKLETIKRRITE